MISYGLGAGFLIAGLALALAGGRAISTRAKPSADSRIWIGSTLAFIGAVLVAGRALLWLIAA